MSQNKQKPSLWQYTLYLGEEFGAKTVNSLLALSLVYASIFPIEALAFVNDINTPHTALKFRSPERYASNIASGKDLDLIPAPVAITPNMRLIVTASAYTSAIEETDGNPFRTASGTQTRESVVAANFLPFGSIIQIYDKFYVVEDRMNARYNGRLVIDIWMNSLQDALTFGVKKIPITIISIPENN